MSVDIETDSILEIVEKVDKVVQIDGFKNLSFDSCIQVDKVVDPPTSGSNVVVLGQPIPNGLRAVENHKLSVVIKCL